MNLLHPLIDDNKTAYGKVDRRALTTFPQALRSLQVFPKKGDISTLQKKGHFYFVLTRKLNTLTKYLIHVKLSPLYPGG